MVEKGFPLGDGGHVSQCIHLVQTRDPAAKPVSLKKFKHLLVDQLKAKANSVIDPDEPQRKVKRGRPSLDLNARFIGNTHIVKYVKKDRDSAVLSAASQVGRKATERGLAMCATVVLESHTCTPNIASRISIPQEAVHLMIVINKFQI